MPLSDEEAALLAIASLEEASPAQQAAEAEIASLLHGSTEPFVDIHQLFRLYDTLYFRDALLPRVEVSWSLRLTLCAGICELLKDENGKYRRIRLKLSEPLLKFRPQEDTINTLLHEAIHAYFFVTSSWRHSRGDDGTGHGKGFLLLADAISNHGNYEITVYHTFHDEVDSYQTHIWQCDGPCRTKAPFFGVVKRSMNRPPGKGKHSYRPSPKLRNTLKVMSGGRSTKTNVAAPTRKPRSQSLRRTKSESCPLKKEREDRKTRSPPG